MPYNRKMSTTIKLASFLARSGIAARRKSEELILQGWVSVNGEVETNVARRVDPETDKVSFKGEPIVQSEEKVLLALHKPRGVVSTVSDPDGKPVVTKYVPAQYQHLRFFPIGRLDEETEGLILLTNDGDFAQRVTHPKYEVPKTYRVSIEGSLTDNEIDRLETGLKLKDFRAKPAVVDIIDADGRGEILDLTIHEGKNHEVRRMMMALNHPVRRLVRLSVGPYELGDLRAGQVREEDFSSLVDSLIVE
jgi:23S rRNA pseudouridine2605 synthase